VTAVRYQHIVDGIAQAVRRKGHYIPEGLNALSAFLIGASGFSGGNWRWGLLLVGVAVLLFGTVLGVKRGRENDRDSEAYRAMMGRLEADILAEQETVARLEADNQRERNAIRAVLGRLAQELCHELSLWDEWTRITVYGHIDDGTASGFLPLARCSRNPRFERLGRSFYKDSEVGYLGVAWEEGVVQRSFRLINGAREDLWRSSTDIAGHTRKAALSREEAEALELTMEPRSVIGIRLDEDRGAVKHGVILFESMILEKLSNQQLNDLLTAPQVRSLRIVMIAVSELFRSITVAQAAKEAAE